MEAVRIEAIMQGNGTLTIENLPFSSGEPVEVIVLANAQATSQKKTNAPEKAVHPFEGQPVVFLQDPFEPAGTEEQASRYPLRGTPYTYLDPLEPVVAPEEWEALK